MVVALDITGQRFGRLVAINRVSTSGRRSVWAFRCDCGTVKEIRLENVRGGITESCGCIRKEKTASRSATHRHTVGRKSTATYRAYAHAKGRCTNPRDPKFANYGGRGVVMCERWLAGFENFLADMGEKPSGLTLDRIDVNGPYAPGNCRWATVRTQARNRTDNVWVEHGGAHIILKDYAALRGVRYKSLHRLVRYEGMSAEKAADRLSMRQTGHACHHGASAARTGCG